MLRKSHESATLTPPLIFKGCLFCDHDISIMYDSDAGTGGPGGPLAPPIFGRSVNPIPTRGGQTIPPYYYGPPPPKFFTFRHHCMKSLETFENALAWFPQPILEPCVNSLRTFLKMQAVIRIRKFVSKHL